MRLLNFRLLLLVFFISAALSSYASEAGIAPLKDTVSYISPFLEDNEQCFKCHGQEKYEYTNESLGRKVNALMCSEKILTVTVVTKLSQASILRE
jgi:hypothetical protein